MFEGIIEQLILRYLGEYIEDLDRNKLSLGIWSGSLSLENILLKAKTINDLKLPFKLILGKISKLTLRLDWKSIFSSPTEIVIEGLTVVVSLLNSSEWEPIDYFSFKTKIGTLLSHAEKLHYNLVQSFNNDASNNNQGYTSKLLINILDNLHLVFKNVHIRIEETNKTPNYSMGVTLKEILIVNTNDKWEQVYIDRNKNESIEKIYKLMRVNNFGVYLEVDEKNIISKYPTAEVEKKMNLIFPPNDDCVQAQGESYTIPPMSIEIKMTQNNEENKIDIYIELEKFHTEVQKEQFNCFIFILNQVSSYQKFQNNYYETRKFHYFKPYGKDKKTHAKEWLIFEFNMVLKQIQFIRGNKKVFNVDEKVLEEDKENFYKLFKAYYLNKKNSKSEPLNDEDLSNLERVVYVTDIITLKEWVKDIIEKRFKEEKIEEKKYANTSYFSYFFGLSSNVDESKLLTQQEQEKLNELFSNELSNQKRNKFSITFSLMNCNFKCSKNYSNANNTMIEGFETRFKKIYFFFNQDVQVGNFSIMATLQDFEVEMLTIVNKTINRVPMTFKTKTKPEFDYVVKTGLVYKPTPDVNFELELHVTDVSFMYHQVFLGRVINFFKIKAANEELTNKAFSGMKTLSKATQSAVKENIKKKNIIKVQVDPRKIIIPINKNDIKNSKILTVNFGNILMNTENEPEEKVNDEKYKNSYTLFFDAVGVEYCESIEQMEKSTKVISEVSGKIGFSFLKSIYSSKEYPAFKLFLIMNKANINLTNYTYTILIYIIQVLKPIQQKDLWSQITNEKKEIATNARASAILHKRNWITKSWESFLALVSGGYIYFYRNSKDENYTNYFYLKDSIITPNKEQNVIKIVNFLGEIELKFSNEKKFKQWEICLQERIHEMQTSDQQKSEIIGEELKQIKADKTEIFCGAEISLGTVNCILSSDITSTAQKEDLFSISIEKMKMKLLLRQFDTRTSFSIQGVKIFDLKTTEESFKQIINSEDEKDKETKLVSLNIFLATPQSPDYKNEDISIELNFGYLYVIWNPIVIRRLLLFLAHNRPLRQKVLSEISNPNEKAVEDQFVMRSKVNKNDTHDCCKDVKSVYINLHSAFKKVNIILIQPIKNIFYHELSLGESYLDCIMYVDHFCIKGELGNTQIWDLCEYPFVIREQKYFVPENKKEIFGINNDDSDGRESHKEKNLIKFVYNSYSKWCPKFKDNYASEADVSINSTFLVYVQEQFMRFLNFFLSELLGALAPPPLQKEEEKEKGDEEKEKQKEEDDASDNPQEMNFMRLNLVIDKPKIILKPRPWFEKYFQVNAESVKLKCYYNKIYERIRERRDEWRWLSTYQINLNKFSIETNDQFNVLSPTDGIINMHFTCCGEKDKQMSPFEFDFSYQFDIFISALNLNMRQKDYTFLMNCNDLNILYTDNEAEQYNYEKLKLKKSKSDVPEEPEREKTVKEKYNEQSKKRLLATYSGMLTGLYIPQITLNLFLNDVPQDGLAFAQLSLYETLLFFDNKLDFSKKMELIINDVEVFHIIDKASKEIIISHFSNEETEIEFDDIKTRPRQRKSQGSKRVRNSIRVDNAIFSLESIKKNLSPFCLLVLNKVKKCQPIQKEISEEFYNSKMKINIDIDIKREKTYLIKLSDLKLIFKLDTIYLIQTFFMEGFPFYDKHSKDLPNLFDSNEENYPGMKFIIEIHNPIICFLSDDIDKRDQELYCISSDIKVQLIKQKITTIKEELGKTKKNIIRILNSDPQVKEDQEIKKTINDKLNNLKFSSWKLKTQIFNISPFISQMNQILLMKKGTKRKIIENFNMTYSTKTQVQIKEDDLYHFFNKVIFKVDQVTAYMSFRDIILLIKVIKYNSTLLGDEYKKAYESLIYFSKEKEKAQTRLSKGKVNNEDNPDHHNSEPSSREQSLKVPSNTVQTGETFSKYSINGFNVLFIDNQSNSYFPFLIVDVSNLYSIFYYNSFTLQNKKKLRLYLTLSTFNYLAGVWEPLLEKVELQFTQNYSETETSSSMKYDVELNPNSNFESANINISDLSMVFLYSIYSRWTSLYYQMVADYQTTMENIENSEKNLKISNRRVYNYTGRKMFITKTTFAPIQSENSSVYQGKASVTSSFLIKNIDTTREKIIGEIEPNTFFEIEFYDSISMGNEHTTKSQSQKYETQIRFEIENASCNDNELTSFGSRTMNHVVDYQDIELSKSTSNFSYIISEILTQDKKKVFNFFSPLTFKNETQFELKFVFKNKVKKELPLIIKPKEIKGVPVEFFEGTTVVLINGLENKAGYYSYNTFFFFKEKKIERELNFNGTYINFYRSESECSRTRIIQIKTCYAIRNCLPFDVRISFQDTNDKKDKEKKKEMERKSLFQEIYLQKGDTFDCHMVSMKSDLVVHLEFLKFRTLRQANLYSVSKPTLITPIFLSDSGKENCEIICSIIKDTKTTAILRPYSIAINHAYPSLKVWYDKPQKGEVPLGHDAVGSNDGSWEGAANIYLLKSNTKFLKLFYKDFYSESFLVDVPGTSRNIIFSNKKKESFEISMENKICLLASDLDLYCNIICLEPKRVFVNNLDVSIKVTSSKRPNELFELEGKKRKVFNLLLVEENEVKLEFVEQNKKWETIYPFKLESTQLKTIEVYDITNKRKKYLNVSMTIKGITMFYILDVPNIDTASFSVFNYSNFLSFKLYQYGSQSNDLFMDLKSKSIFTWEDDLKEKYLCIDYGFGSLSSQPFIKETTEIYEIKEGELIIRKKEDKSIIEQIKMPCEKNLLYQRNQYVGNNIKFRLMTNGIRYQIIFEDIIKDSSSMKLKTKKQETSFYFQAPKIGISIITDNFFIDCEKNLDKYSRKEICFISIEDFEFLNKEEKFNEIETNEKQLKFKYFEIDNDSVYNPSFPIFISPVFENGKSKLSSNKPFFNFSMCRELNLKDKTEKISKLNYLIQSFYLNVESNMLSSILKMVSNIKRGLKTLKTKAHPIFVRKESNPFDGESNENALIQDYEYLSYPEWLNEKNFELSSNIYIQELEASSLEINFSFLNQSKDKVFENLLENNPVISKVLSLFSNVQNTKLTLNGCSRQNVSVEISTIITSLITIYSQNALSQIMKLVVNTEILGTPINLFQSIGSGVKDFFRKPFDGIVQGPLEAMKGIFDGSTSLLKNTFDGTFNTTSKMTAGISKGLLLITQDDKYINNREKKIMLEKPNTLVEGLGFGLTSMAGGLFYGVTDLVRMPIKGAKKDGLGGFGKGLLQGFGSIVAKPISGVLDMVSKTTEGLKNTVRGEAPILQARLPRTFYGNFKYIQSYNKTDAQIIYYIKKNIDFFKNIEIDYNASAIYLNKEDERALLVFGTRAVYLIDYDRFELRAAVSYTNIKELVLKKNKIRINFNGLINKKSYSTIKFSKKETNVEIIYEVFKEVINNSFIQD